MQNTNLLPPSLIGMMDGCSKAFLGKSEIREDRGKERRRKVDTDFVDIENCELILPVDTIRLSFSQSMVAGGEAKTTQRIL